MRHRVELVGTVSAVTYPGAGSAQAVRARFHSDSGEFILAFLGRSDVACLEVGSPLSVRGVVTQANGVPTMFNPDYTVLAGAYE